MVEQSWRAPERRHRARAVVETKMVRYRRNRSRKSKTQGDPRTSPLEVLRRVFWLMICFGLARATIGITGSALRTLEPDT